MSAGEGRSSAEAMQPARPVTKFREGVGANVGPVAFGIDTTGAYAEAGRPEPEKTKFAEKREAAAAKKERVTVKQEDIDAEKEAEEKEEKLTNKYDDGVGQVEDYFREVFGNREHDYAIESTAQVQAALEAAGINFLPGEMTPAEYAHKAAQIVFHQVRVGKFGDAALARGGNIQGETTRLRDKLRWRGFRIRRQIASARTTAKTWREEMGQRQDAFNDAEIAWRWKVNAGRGEMDASAAALAGMVNGAADSARDTHAYTERGTLINPLESVLTRLHLVREPVPDTSDAGAQGESDVVAAIREQLTQPQRAFGERMRSALIGAVDRMRLPADIMESVVGADFNISSMLEGVLGVAGQTPEAAFRAHEALLDLQTLSNAMLKVSKGRLNIMLQLNRILAEQTKGLVSVTDLEEATRALADDYVVRHPEQGIAKLLHDTRRQGWEMGGYTPTQRKVLRARYAAARHDFVTKKVLRRLETEKGAEDPYLRQPEEAEKPATEEYRPKWGWLNQTERARKWREDQAKQKAEEAARKKRRNEIPNVTPTAAAANAEFNRTRESISGQQTPEDLATMLRQRAESMRQAREQAQAPVQPAVEDRSAEEEAALRRQEDQQVENAAKRVAELQREAAAAALRADVSPRAIEDLADNLDAASAYLTQLRSDVDARRNPPAEQPATNDAADANLAGGNDAAGATEQPAAEQTDADVRAQYADYFRQQAAANGADLSDADASNLADLTAAALRMRDTMVAEGTANPTVQDVVARLRTEADLAQNGNQATGGLPGPQA